MDQFIPLSVLSPGPIRESAICPEERTEPLRENSTLVKVHQQLSLPIFSIEGKDQRCELNIWLVKNIATSIWKTLVLTYTPGRPWSTLVEGDEQLWQRHGKSTLGLMHKQQKHDLSSWTVQLTEKADPLVHLLLLKKASWICLFT